MIDKLIAIADERRAHDRFAGRAVEQAADGNYICVDRWDDETLVKVNGKKATPRHSSRCTPDLADPTYRAAARVKHGRPY